MAPTCSFLAWVPCSETKTSTPRAASRCPPPRSPRPRPSPSPTGSRRLRASPSSAPRGGPRCRTGAALLLSHPPKKHGLKHPREHGSQPQRATRRRGHQSRDRRAPASLSRCLPACLSLTHWRGLAGLASAAARPQPGLGHRGDHAALRAGATWAHSLLTLCSLSALTFCSLSAHSLLTLRSLFLRAADSRRVPQPHSRDEDRARQALRGRAGSSFTHFPRAVSLFSLFPRVLYFFQYFVCFPRAFFSFSSTFGQIYSSCEEMLADAELMAKLDGAVMLTFPSPLARVWLTLCSLYAHLSSFLRAFLPTLCSPLAHFFRVLLFLLLCLRSQVSLSAPRTPATPTWVPSFWRRASTC